MIWTGRAGAPEVAAGRAGVIQAGAALLRGPGVHLLIRDGVLQDWEMILSFFGYFGTDYI